MASEKLTLGRMRTGHAFRQVQRSAYSDEEIPDPPGVQLDVDGRSVSREAKMSSFAPTVLSIASRQVAADTSSGSCECLSSCRLASRSAALREPGTPDAPSPQVIGSFQAHTRARQRLDDTTEVVEGREPRQCFLSSRNSTSSMTAPIVRPSGAT